MSKWSEYGYTDVLFQPTFRALDGFFGAYAERLRFVGGGPIYDNAFYYLLNDMDSNWASAYYINYADPLDQVNYHVNKYCVVNGDGSCNPDEVWTVDTIAEAAASKVETRGFSIHGLLDEINSRGFSLHRVNTNDVRIPYFWQEWCKLLRYSKERHGRYYDGEQTFQFSCLTND